MCVCFRRLVAAVLIAFFALVGVSFAQDDFSSASSTWGQVKESFSWRLTVNGDSPMRFTANGLPHGVTLDADLGLLQGVPRVAGDYPVHVQTVGADLRAVASQRLRIFVYPQKGSAPEPTGGEWNWRAAVGESLDYTPGFIGDPAMITPGAAFRWENLPPGLRFNPMTLRLEGTAERFGIFSSTLELSNPFGSTIVPTVWVVRDFQGTSPVVSLPPLVAIEGKPMNEITPVVVEGIVTRFTIRGLPGGLTYDETNGTITGTPERIERTFVEVVAEGPDGVSEIFQTGANIVHESDLLTQLFVNFQSPLRAAQEAEGSLSLAGDDSLAGLVHWRAEGLPSGLTLDGESGRLYGTPTAAGVYQVVIHADHPLKSATWTREMFVRGDEWQRQVLNWDVLGEEWVSNRNIEEILYGKDVLLIRTDGLVALSKDEGETLLDVGLRGVNGLAFDGERFVALVYGDTRETAYSTDGELWARAAWNDQSQYLTDLAALPTGVLVAMDIDGRLVWSDDGMDWQPAQGLDGLSLQERPLIGANGRFLIFPSGAPPYSSTDGRLFAPVETFPNSEDIFLQQAIFQGGRFFAMGETVWNGQPQVVVFVSSDTLEWVRLETSSMLGSPLAATFLDGRYFLLTSLRLYHSNNGQHWLDTSFPENSSGLPEYLIHMTSDDDMLWLSRYGDTLYGHGLDFAPVLDFEDGLFRAPIVLGTPVAIDIPVKGAVDHFLLEGELPLGVSFDPATGRFNGLAEQAIEGTYQFSVEAGLRGIYSASETLLLTVVRPEDSLPDFPNPLVIVGFEGQRAQESLSIPYTGRDFQWQFEGLPSSMGIDGLTLTGNFPAAGRYEGAIKATNAFGSREGHYRIDVGASPFASMQGPKAPRAMAANAHGFVAVARNQGAMVSSDGRTWQQIESLEAVQLYNVRVWRDTFYAVGAHLESGGSVIFASDDGSHWRAVFPDSPEETNAIPAEKIMDVADGPAGLLAVGERGRVFRSADGEAWTVETPATLVSRSRVSGICIGHGRYVASFEGGVPMASTDGVDWEDGEIPHTLASGLGVSRVAFAIDAFWLVGGSHVLMRSEDGLDWSEVLPPFDGYLFGVDALGDTLWISGANGKAAKTRDGDHWQNYHVDLRGTDLYGVAAKDGLLAAYSLRRTGAYLADAPMASTLSLPVSKAFAIEGQSWTQALLLTGDADEMAVYGLPPGVGWNANTRQLVGMPTMAGDYELQFVTHGPAGSSLQWARLIVESALPDPPTIVASAVDVFPPSVNSNSIEISDLTPSTELVIGGLPSGLFLSRTTSTWDGHTTERGAFPITIRVTNRAGSIEHHMTLWVSDQPSYELAFAPGYGVAGEEISYTWALADDAINYRVPILPSGIRFDPDRLSLRGQPESPGEHWAVIETETASGTRAERVLFHINEETESESEIPSLPTIVMKQNDSNIELRWLATDGGLELQHSGDLMSWTPAPGSQQLIGDYVIHALSLEGSYQFYRLQRLTR